MDTKMIKGKGKPTKCIEKGNPLNKDETKALLAFVEKNKVILSKCTNATNNSMKKEEWLKIAREFNASVSTCKRTSTQLRLKWDNMKKNARKRSAKISTNRRCTGGGPPDYIPPNDILDRVSDLLGGTASGYTVKYGGDKENLSDADDSGDDIVGGQAEVSKDLLNSECFIVPENGIGRNAYMPIVAFEGTEETLLSTGEEMSIDITPPAAAAGSSTDCELPKELSRPQKKRKRDMTPPAAAAGSSTDCEELSRPQKKHFTFSSTSKRGKTKSRPQHKESRDIALAEYYKVKKEYVDAKVQNLLLSTKS